MRGRKPAGQTVAKGNGYVPPTPEGLGKVALDKWGVVVPFIANQVELRDGDADLLRQYVEAWAMRCKAVEELDSQPLTLATPNGTLQINPLIKIISQKDKELSSLAERFGLDPASRKRLNISSGSAGDSAFADFMNRKKK